MLSESTPLLNRQRQAESHGILRRGLKARHLIMMSVGGTVGTGLFVASGLTIATAGPVGALVAYLIVGIMVFCVLTSLGEMAALIPVSGSFHDFAGRFVDPALAWTLGWNYWLQWAISLTSEVTAAGIILTFWFPNTPAWMFSAGILFALTILNTRSVSFFGETEYWLSFIKVAAVLLFICVGAYVDQFGFGGDDPAPPLGFQNWFIEGAPFKNGITGILSVISLAFFAFGGTELVGISAGEVEDPRKNESSGCVIIANDDPSLSLSAKSGDVSIAPFTLILQRAGLTSAANLMNLVILTAVVSTANSAMYAASRTLMSLSQRGQAHQMFGYVNSNGVPVWAVAVTVAIGSLAFLGIILGGTSGLLTWLSISVTHIRFRAALKVQGKSLATLPYAAPLFPYSDYAALFIGLVILIGQAYVAIYGGAEGNVDYRMLLSIVGGVPLFFGLYLGYRMINGFKFVDLRNCDLGVIIS
ncbi:hypothetical protein HK100_000069 [Physocladia obscura]|uniref:Amino acid permease/ SLC12A domain-containing protein n=1 Tax=Physocladia obscura TaxID=109957 RepID=A0AAD5T1R4_9FUNG|nr:hypothetical protein HK100_000069 [Physocladia obscura]